MNEDDRPVGRILSRREAVHLLSAAGCAIFAPVRTGEAYSGVSWIPGCVVRPELTEGPFFADVQLDRSDIRTEPTTGALVHGRVLNLTFNMSRIDGSACAPLSGAIVNIWQCDASGRYSAFRDRRSGGDVEAQQFLRGYQITSDDGVARFTTIYPVWYRGRAVHIHFKIRAEAAPDKAYEFTSQLFFEEALTDRVHARPPYAARGQRDTRNTDDGIFRRSGDQLTLALSPEGGGFASAFDIGLDLSDDRVGRPHGSRGSRRGVRNLP